MAGNPKQKLKLLYISEYLKKYTDDEHCVSVPQIIEYLEEQGISAERKSIYQDIDILREYGLSIIRGQAPMNGYFLSESDFQLSELKMLVDAVKASPVISRKKTAELIRKLESMGSIYQAQSLEAADSRSKAGDFSNKTDNEEFYYNIDRIHTAIQKGKKIRFFYRKRTLVNNLPVFDNGREFIISPYAALWHQDKYYVVGNYEKYDDLSHYRIDRMKHVDVCDQPVRRLSEVSRYKAGFDAADYTKTVFNMYAGDKPEPVELECSIDLLEVIIERFGINIPFRKIGEDRFSVRVSAVINDGFEKWLLNLGGSAIVRSPDSLRDSLRKRLESMLKQFR